MRSGQRMPGRYHTSILPCRSTIVVGLTILPILVILKKTARFFHRFSWFFCPLTPILTASENRSKSQSTTSRPTVNDIFQPTRNYLPGLRYATAIVTAHRISSRSVKASRNLHSPGSSNFVRFDRKYSALILFSQQVCK